MLSLPGTKILAFLSFSLLLFSAGVQAAPGQDTLKAEYLLLRGIIREMKIGESDKSLPLDSVDITVYIGETELIQGRYRTNKKGKCEFKIPLHRKFDIRVSKPGYVSKLIRVNTQFNSKAVPEKKLSTNYDFPFEVDIFEEVSGLDVKVLEKPIAKVGFSYSTFGFEYDANYTGKINAELRRMYKDYYLLLKMAADTLNRQQDTIRNKVVHPAPDKSSLKKK